IGEEDSIQDSFREEADQVIDAGGNAIIPGFIDPHTHAVFAGDRSDEFIERLRGKTYQEILDEGGGILRTVRVTRNASENDLVERLLAHLDRMLRHGTTTVEIKSGYGLDVETELKMLRVMEQADEQHPVDIVPTFLGAHAVPDGMETEAYVDHVIEDQLPAVAEQGIARFCDVFCEEDVFSVSQSRRILEAGMEYGMEPKIHAEEFTRLGGAQLSADIGAVSADHLLQANEDDAAALAGAGVVPVLLPGTAFSLETTYADPALFQQHGAEVALATDFNPNCHTHSMGFMVALACNGMRMPPGTALQAATTGAAAALDLDRRGLLVEGAPADLCILDTPRWVDVGYSFGTNSVSRVVKGGDVVHER
ncbi:MAG: imidazolonepropionase, partial [Candidatus Nanohaloarchaea archaeon]|nr:imidazolonepropionase [Candidatus Nanohaloarchaea archaeon]